MDDKRASVYLREGDLHIDTTTPNATLHFNDIDVIGRIESTLDNLEDANLLVSQLEADVFALESAANTSRTAAASYELNAASVSAMIANLSQRMAALEGLVDQKVAAFDVC